MPFHTYRSEGLSRQGHDLAELSTPPLLRECMGQF